MSLLTSSSAGDSDPPFLAASAISLEKKRARDRRAQQTFRNKQNERVNELEKQVQKLQITCDNLRCENQVLRSRQDAVSTLVRSWQGDPIVLNGWPITDPAINKLPATVSLTFDLLLLPATLPAWAATPNHPEHDPYGETQPRWAMIDPEIVTNSPEQPSPIELLYGSRRNKLADAIHKDMSQWRCRDPERLASGWLIYMFAKWLYAPSEEKYDRLPKFLRPLPEQCSQQHLAGIDGFWWPLLRKNLILKDGEYNFAEVVGLFACCLRVRWPWGENMLVPGEDSDWYVRPEFHKTFMSLDGWGLTNDFMQAYPELVEGLNADSICYELN